MHEMSITQSLLDIVLAEAEKAGAKRVTAIHLKIGAFTGVVADAVAFYLDFLAKDTPAEGARLVATTVPATIYCPACNATWPATVDDLVFLCPSCHGPVQITGGHDLFVESIEVE